MQVGDLGGKSRVNDGPVRVVAETVEVENT
jgi:hypothetical protein